MNRPVSTSPCSAEPNLRLTIRPHGRAPLFRLAAMLVRLIGSAGQTGGLVQRDGRGGDAVDDRGATPKAPFVKAGRPGRTGSQSQHPNAILAQQAESQIIELIKTTPGLKTTEIAKETGSKVNTTTQRLARMRERGLITRGDGGSGWAAAAPA